MEKDYMWISYQYCGNNPITYNYQDINGPNRLTSISGINNQFYSESDYSNTGELSSKFTKEKSGDLWNNRFDFFEYNTSGLLETYKFNNIYSTSEINSNCINDEPLTVWKYRYSVNGEREQKRLYSTKQPNTVEAYPWVYYLLGIDNKQLAVYNGLQTSLCQSTEEVYFYPSEYLTYGSSGLSNIITRIDGTKEYSLFDHLGSVRTRLNQSGEVIANYDYEPFGQIIGKVEEPRLNFIDKEKDKESELSDFGVRKYDDITGRFTSIDPMWELYFGWTPYHYCRNNPIIRYDGSGFADYFNERGKYLGTDGIMDTRSDQYITNKILFSQAQSSGNWNDIQQSKVPNEATNEEINNEMLYNYKSKLQEEGIIQTSTGTQTDIIKGDKQIINGIEYPLGLDFNKDKTLDNLYDTKQIPDIMIHIHTTKGSTNVSKEDMESHKKVKERNAEDKNTLSNSIMIGPNKFYNFYNENGLQYSLPDYLIREIIKKGR